MTHDHDAWELYTEQAFARVREHQASMVETFALSGNIQYHWDLDEAVIVFSRGGEEFARGQLTMVGSVDHERQTFLWSWANDSLPAAVLGKIEEVREFGAKQEFPLLTSPSYDAEPKLVTQSLVVSADILAAQGIWRDHQGTLERLFLIHQLESAV